jgi:hypothetical protein
MNYLNEDFIDDLDVNQDVTQNPEDAADFEGGWLLDANFNMLHFQDDTMYSKKFGDEYNIWTRYIRMRTVMERMGFAGAHKIETRFYVFYKDGMDEKFEIVNVTLTPDKHYVKDYIDAEYYKNKYLSYNVSFQIELRFVPAKTTFRKFVSDIQSFCNALEQCKNRVFETNGQMYTSRGWYPFEKLEYHPENYKTMYEALYPGEKVQKTAADVVYNQSVIEDIMRQFTEKHKENVESWKIERQYFDHMQHVNYTSVYVPDRHCIFIYIDGIMTEEETPNRRNFYNDMLTWIKDDIFKWIPMNIKRLFSICVIVHPNEKMIIPAPYKRADVCPPDRDDYRYLTNYNSGLGRLKCVLSLVVGSGRNNSQMVVAFMKHNKSEFNITGKFTYPTGYKWLQLVQP